MGAPIGQDEIVVNPAAADPEVDILGTTGVFHPVDDLHHATLPNQGDDMGGTVTERRLIIGA
jgi:hypothetical protein